MGSKAMFKWSKQITPSLVGQLFQAERDLQKAILIFDSATAEYAKGFQHDHSTFSLMISKLVSANQFRSAEELLNRMKEEKCNITEDIFLSICRAYGRVHRLLDAVRIFHTMKDFQCKPTKKSYITVFAILVEENQLKIALRFYRHMREIGIPPSIASLNVLIKALCKNSGTMDSAFQIFREMPNCGCTPDSYTYGTLINGLCRFGKIGKAKELFKEMETKCLCTNGDPNRAFQLYLSMRSRGISINTGTFDSLVECFCERGDLHKAAFIVDEMVIDGCVPAEGTWNAVVGGFWDRR
ncbi:pentatricopeptide repeat-containing protein At5g46100 [Fagus crenata]